ncbi:MAG TPA: TonB-dependent receptor [Vicinamibacterales bacterium]|nr:TonB-dependent receptor [Vicinamibacterales bacterium]
MNHPRHLALAGLAALACAAPLHAQAAAEPPNISQVTTGISADVLRDLPTSDTIFSLLETTEPSLTSDRMSGSGAYTGQAPRISGFFSSWSQTLYRIGDVSISDPTGSGAPLLAPDPEFWGNLQMTTGMMPASINAQGVAITLTPHAPSATWTTTLAGTAGFPAQAPGAGTPPIVRSDGWDRAVATASGPILTGAHGETRLAGFFGGAWTRGKAINRASTDSVTSTSGSGFMNLVFTPEPDDDLRVIGWVQRVKAPLDISLLSSLLAPTEDNGGHLQAAWEHGARGGVHYRVFGSYTERTRTAPPITSPPIYDDAVDDPVSQLAFRGPSTVRQWTVGAHLPAPATAPAALDAGIELGGARDRSGPAFSGLAGEGVDAGVFREWAFNPPAAPTSNRHMMTATAYASERFTVTPSLVGNAGLRYDGVNGSADGAAAGVKWNSWLPRAGVEWTPAVPLRPKLFAEVTRTAYRLPLDLLAFGDPGAPTASVFQPGAGPIGVVKPDALIARVGPGSGGDPSFVQFDPKLQRPTTDELAIGLETHPSSSFTLGLRGFLRKERHVLSLVDSGAPASAYTLSTVFDPGNQLENPVDDQQLPIYNRLVSSFGQDKYLVTNSAGDDATSESIEITGRLTSRHVILFGGLSANQSESNAANIGFGPLENDPDVIGSTFVDPNAATFPRGRPFSDRAYTIKISTILRLPADIHAGLIARYQDGQPFSRLVIATGLNQGTEAIRAFPDGGSRFTFTETLDARLQKAFPLGANTFDVVVDVFNLLNTQNEVEERTITGATYRMPTALQQPRTLHAGFRVTF